MFFPDVLDLEMVLMLEENACDSKIRAFLENFEGFFKDGKGSNVVGKLNLKEASQRVCKAWPVPLALKQKIEDKIEKLVKKTLNLLL